MRRSGAAAFAAALALAAPLPALGQSAGDDQYRDPFAGNGGEQDAAGSGGSGSTGGQATGGGGSAPVAAPAPAPAPAPAATPQGTAVAPSATASGELPRTGLPAGVVTAAGLVLLAIGIGLRRTLPA